MDTCLSAPPQGALRTHGLGFLRKSELRGRQSCALPLNERSQRSGRTCVRAEGESVKAADAKPSSNTSPFAGKKISTLLAARRAQEAAAEAQAPAPSAPAGAETPAVRTSALNPSIASLLNTSSPATSAAATPSSEPAAKPVSPFATSAAASTSPSASRASSVNAVPAAAVRPVVSFGKKKVLDALKSDNSLDAMKTAFQPGAPANIFKDEIRSKEQIEAEKFRLEINSGQLLLVVSFFASSILMMGTVYIVWKLGAIHYNEF